MEGFSKQMIEAEVLANVLRVQKLVNDLTCDIPYKDDELEKLADGSPRALVALKMLRQVRQAVATYQPKLYHIG